MHLSANLPPPPPIRLIIHGGAGAGKSNVIRAISKWAEKILRKAGDHPNKPRILLAAPTGMAASLIGGTTLHSAFRFNFGDALQALSDKNIDDARVHLADLKIIILDEMSMVKSDQLYQIHLRIQEIFQNQDLFGGRSMILVGDLLQLQPIQGRYIFQSPNCPKYQPYHFTNPLWDEFEVVVLRHNHRQGEGKTWAQTLNRIREGDLNRDDLGLLMSRLITDTEANKKKEAVHIFYTNAEVDKWNKNMMDGLKAELHISTAIVSMPIGCTSQTDSSGRVDKTSFMRELQLKKRARVMLIHNIDILDSLTNGMIGEVVDFIKNQEGTLSCILVAFDHPSVGEEQRKKYPHLVRSHGKLVTPIFRTEFQYQLPKRGREKHASVAKVLQFPLRCAWAVTCHKVQGQTFKNGTSVVIHWHKRLTEGMAYVMMGKFIILILLNFVNTIFFLKK